MGADESVVNLTGEEEVDQSSGRGACGAPATRLSCTGSPGFPPRPDREVRRSACRSRRGAGGVVVVAKTGRKVAAGDGLGYHGVPTDQGRSRCRADRGRIRRLFPCPTRRIRRRRALRSFRRWDGRWLPDPSNRAKEVLDVRRLGLAGRQVGATETITRTRRADPLQRWPGSLYCAGISAAAGESYRRRTPSRQGESTGNTHCPTRRPPSGWSFSDSSFSDSPTLLLASASVTSVTVMPVCFWN